MMTSLSGTVSRMLREVMFASGVWYCVLLYVSQAVSALATSLAVIPSMTAILPRARATRLAGLGPGSRRHMPPTDMMSDDTILHGPPSVVLFWDPGANRSAKLPFCPAGVTADVCPCQSAC